MIGRAATSAVRRVCSMLAHASKSTPTNFSFKMDPDLNQFFKRFTSFIRPGDHVKKTIPSPGDPFVKFTASGELSLSSLEVETSVSDNDNNPIFYLNPNYNDNKPIFYLSRNFNGGFHIIPISLEDDGSLSPKPPIFAPYQLQPSSFIFEGYYKYNFNGVFFLAKQGPHIYAWNPATSEVRELPVSPHKVNRMLGKTVTKGSVFVATWTDPKSKDYKLLNIFSYGDGDYIYENSYPIEFELYSLKTDSWKKLRWEGEFQSWDYRGCSCYINGVIYIKIWAPDTKQCILCFDFPSETFSILPLPAGIRDAYQLVKYNGQLSVFSAINLGPDEKDMVHWVRKNGEWVKVGVYYLYGDLCKPLGFARNNELLMFQRWCPVEKIYSLMVFDSTTGELKLVPGDCVSTGDFLLFDFHDTSFLTLKPPSEYSIRDIIMLFRNRIRDGDDGDDQLLEWRRQKRLQQSVYMLNSRDI